MRRQICFGLTLLFVLVGCSVPHHEDQWRYDAAAATRSYGDAFLKGDDIMAASAYEQALVASKQSGDLLPLARFRLTRCALNHAVLIDDDCSAYLEVAPVAPSPELEAYFAMLNGTLRHEQLLLLPPQYRSFFEARLANNPMAASKLLQAVTPLRSKMIAASSAPELLNDATIESIIDDASHFGYRRAVIAWTRYLIRTTSDAGKRTLLQRKLELLE